MDKGNAHKQLLSSEIRRSVVRLFKLYLNNLEDIKHLHTIAGQKLASKLSGAEIETLNYLDDNHYELIRKRVLDNGNEAIRDLANLLDKFEVSLNEDLPSREHLVIRRQGGVLAAEDKNIKVIETDQDIVREKK